MSTASATTWFTPPEIGQQLRVDPSKVLGWIAAGELVAVNTATGRSGRPRWKISAEALANFLAARSSRPHPKQAARRRNRTAVREYV
jgi:hypothetical protein